MANTGTFTCLKLHIQMVEGGKHGETEEDRNISIFVVRRLWKTSCAMTASCSSGMASVWREDHPSQ